MEPCAIYSGITTDPLSNAWIILHIADCIRLVSYGAIRHHYGRTRERSNLNRGLSLVTLRRIPRDRWKLISLVRLDVRFGVIRFGGGLGREGNGNHKDC